jgi:uncharacterized SAM-binding protein YcdF (DUF218 family)
MFFALSKIFWLLAAPSHMLGLLVLAAGILALAGRVRAARWFAVAAALLLVVAGILPLHVWLTRSLEDRYPRPAWPAHVDGILMLGAGFDTAILKVRGVPPTNGGEMRVIAGFEAARRYPHAKLVFSGGSGVLGGAGGEAWSEAETARYIFAQMGLDPARLILEPRSRNTYENILFTRTLVKPKPGEVWLLVTSAIHMPRALGVARKLGWPMLPWPTDYMTGPWGGHADFDIAGNLGTVDYAVHEWIGQWAYRLAGKSSGG